MVEFKFSQDLMFKLVLQAVPKAAVELARHFIPDMDGLVYDESFVVDNPINAEGVDLKTSIFDFKFTINNNSFEYEMQNSKTNYDLTSRILKYYGDLIVSSFPKDDRFNHKKCYALWFLNYKLFYDDNPMRTFVLKDQYNNGLIDYASITIVEFAKISEEEYNKDVWKKLFITNDIESLKGVDEVMDEVVKKILDYNSDEAIQEQLRAEQEWVRGYNSAVNASLEQGKIEANKATAKKLLNLGVDIKIISESTGLTVEEINNL